MIETITSRSAFTFVNWLPSLMGSQSITFESNEAVERHC